MPNNQHYVYALTNPLKNNQPFYIGLGKGNRAFTHLYNWTSTYRGNPHKHHTIDIIRKNGLEPGVTLLYEHISREDAGVREIEEIAKYGRKQDGGTLTNLSKGGDGHSYGQRAVSQYNLFGEYIQTFSSLLEALKYLDHSHSSSIVDCCKKKGTQRAAFGFFWAYATEELDKEWIWHKKRPIAKYSPDGTFLNRYVNAKQAAELSGFPKSSSEITKCCKGIYKQCQGYVWKYYS